MSTGWLLDGSAAARADRPELAGTLVTLLRAGLLWTCPPLDVAALALARSAAVHRRLRADRHLAYRHVPTTPEAHERALVFQALLLGADPPAALAPERLLVAATAQLHDLSLLHCDPALEVLARRCGVVQHTLPQLAGLPGWSP